MSQKRVQLMISGRVQAVYFRASAQREARRLGLTGWAKNRTNSTLEITVEGDEERVKEFLGWAQHGPSTARVDRVDTKWRGYTGDFDSFRIL